MSRLVAIAIGVAAILIAATPARAQYGALAYDENTRAWGQSHGMGSPREAERTALGYCRSGGCRIVVRTGPGQCSAIAASAHSGTWYHWSAAGSRGGAEHDAIRGCERDSGQSCTIQVWQCN